VTPMLTLSPLRQALACDALLDFVAIGSQRGMRPIAALPLDILLPFSQVRSQVSLE
jgi:hypothetical protein